MTEIPAGYDPGLHNADLHAQQVRLLRGQGHRDCSTLIVHVTKPFIHADVVANRFAVIGAPMMNQRIGHVVVTGETCQGGYNLAIEQMLLRENPPRFVLTLESDVLVPPDILARLVRALGDDTYDAVCGLCWTRGYPGQPMVMGVPAEEHYRPQVPLTSGVQPTRAVHLGATLIRTAIFRDTRMPRPWFREDCGLDGEPNGRTSVDLYFSHQAGKLGYRFGVDCDTRVGHRDEQLGQVF